MGMAPRKAFFFFEIFSPFFNQINTSTVKIPLGPSLFQSPILIHLFSVVSQTTDRLIIAF
jgi:hypothetical protein